MNILIKIILIAFGVFVTLGGIFDKNYASIIFGLYGTMLFFDFLWKKYSFNKNKRVIYGIMLILMSLFTSVAFYKNGAFEEHEFGYSLAAFLIASFIYGLLFKKEKSKDLDNSNSNSKVYENYESEDIEDIDREIEKLIKDIDDDFEFNKEVYVDCGKILRDATKLNELKDYDGACDLLLAHLDECDAWKKIIPYLQKAGRLYEVEDVVKKYLDKTLKEVINLNNKYNEMIKWKNSSSSAYSKKDIIKTVEMYKRYKEELPNRFSTYLHSIVDKCRLVYYREGIYITSLYYFIFRELLLSFGNDTEINITDMEKKFRKKVSEDLIENVKKLFEDKKSIDSSSELLEYNRKVAKLLDVDELDLSDEFRTILSLK